MVTRERSVFVLTSALLAAVGLSLVACGESGRKHATTGDGSGGVGGSAGSTGGAIGGSGGSGNAATGGSGAAGASGGADTGGTGAGGDAGGGGGEESASFHWIEPTEEHRERAAAATTEALLRTVVAPAFDDSVLVGTSTLVMGEKLDEIVAEGIVWMEATGTVGLGRLPGGDDIGTGSFSQGIAATPDGSVVVGSAAGEDGDPSAFRWTRTDGMEAISSNYAGAVAVSTDGSVVLGHEQTPSTRAFRWTRALGAVVFEPLPGDTATEPLYLSPDGATVLFQTRGTDGERIVVWTEASGTRAIENLPGYTHCRQEATAVHSYGFAGVGECKNASGGFEVFVSVERGNLVPLGAFDPQNGYAPNQPDAVSADGAVAVGRASSVTDGSRPYRWTEATGLELIELPEGFSSGAPVAGRSTMSADGSVVVGTMGGAARRGFLWSENSGARVLEPLEGHDISDVYAVSADGSVATGSSFRIGAADGIEDQTAVYWRGDGVAHRIADELGAAGFDLGGGALGGALSAAAPLGFVGFGSKDAVSYYLGWRARLPE